MDQQSPPPTQPVTNRVAGGGSGRTAVLLLAGVLGVVAWVGFSGRGPTPPVTPVATGPVAPASQEVPPRPTVFAAESSVPSPRPPSTLGPPTPSPEPILGAIVFGEDAFGVVALIEGRMYLDVLQEVEPGRFRGSFRVPFPTRPGGHTITISQLWTRDERRPSYVELGEWPLRLDPLSEGSEVGGAVLQDGVEARPNLRRVPRAVKRGFTISVRAESRVSFGMVLVEVTFGPRARG